MGGRAGNPPVPPGPAGTFPLQRRDVREGQQHLPDGSLAAGQQANGDAYRYKYRDRSDLRVSVSRLRGPMVLIDHAAYLPAPPREGRGKRHHDRLVIIGWPLVAGLVRPVPVIAPGVSPSTARRCASPWSSIWLVRSDHTVRTWRSV
jgi:hypothetical protein